MSDLDNQDEEDTSHIETLHTEEENETDDENENEKQSINLDEDVTELQLEDRVKPQNDDFKIPEDDDDKSDEEEEEEDDGIDLTVIPKVDELRNSMETISKEDLIGYISLYQQKFATYNKKLEKLKKSKKENVKKHRGSVIDLHNRMFKKLIETETEQKTELQRAQEKIEDLEKELRKFQLREDQIDAQSRGDLASFSSNQIQTLMDSEAALKKLVNEQQYKMKEVEKGLSIERMKHEKTTDSHRKSISTLHTNMFKKLLDAEDDFEDKIDRLTEDLNNARKKLQQERLKNEASDKLRRDSIQTVHNNMLTKLLDAQAEHDEETEKLRQELKNLRHELRKEQLKNEVRAEEENMSDVSDLEEESGTTRKKAKQRKEVKTPIVEREKKRNDEDEDDDDSDSDDDSDKPKKVETFEDLWGDTDEEPEVEISRLKEHVKKLESELRDEKEKNIYIEKQRKDSIHNLHNNMFQKLLDAEFEYEEEIERLHREKEELNEKIIFYEDHFEKINKETNSDQVNKEFINPTEIIDLKQQIKDKNQVIEENKEKIYELSQQIAKLEEKVTAEQKQRRGSVAFLSKQMMDKLLEAEDESSEQKAKYDEKVKMLEVALKESNQNAFKLEKTRRNSLTTVSKAMFQKLLDAEQTKKDLKTKYEKKINELEQQLEIERLKYQTDDSKKELEHVALNQYKAKAETLQKEMSSLKLQHEVVEKKRRESFSELRNNMWKTLLDAEDDYETQINKLKKEILKQQKEINKYKKDIEFLTASKLNLLNQCNQQMDDLRRAVQVYNKNGHKSSWFG